MPRPSASTRVVPRSAPGQGNSKLNQVGLREETWVRDLRERSRLLDERSEQLSEQEKQTEKRLHEKEQELDAVLQRRISNAETRAMELERTDQEQKQRFINLKGQLDEVERRRLEVKTLIQEEKTQLATLQVQQHEQQHQAKAFQQQEEDLLTSSKDLEIQRKMQIKQQEDLEEQVTVIEGQRRLLRQETASLNKLLREQEELVEEFRRQHQEVEDWRALTITSKLFASLAELYEPVLRNIQTSLGTLPIGLRNRLPKSNFRQLNWQCVSSSAFQTRIQSSANGYPALW